MGPKNEFCGLCGRGGVRWASGSQFCCAKRQHCEVYAEISFDGGTFPGLIMRVLNVNSFFVRCGSLVLQAPNGLEMDVYF